MAVILRLGSNRQSPLSSKLSEPGLGRVPEALVGTGFRCWLRHLSEDDQDAMVDAKALASKAVANPAEVTQLLMELATFAYTVASTAQRPVCVAEVSAPQFCRDECLAISMVAAAQHRQHEPMIATGKQLLGCDDVGDLINAAQRVGHRFHQARQRLNRSSVCPDSCALLVLARRTQRWH